MRSALKDVFPLVFVLAALAFLGGCHSDPLGRPCDHDDDCGSGFDCFGDECVAVCTSDDECREGYTCYRYHCIVPGTENQPRKSRAHNNKTTPKKTATRQPTRPKAAAPTTHRNPTPDATITELRAIRRELELLRRDIGQLVRSQKAQTPGNAGSGATPQPRLKPSGVRVPPPPQSP